MIRVQRYPHVEIDLGKIRSNAIKMVDKCKTSGIEVTGVIKGFNGLPEVAEQFRIAGCKHLASSRLEQIQGCIDYGIAGPYMLIRIPMISEIPELVSMVDCSLQSEKKVIEALNLECLKQNKNHDIILMADLGDLREGFWDKEELLCVAADIEKNMEKVHLLGIGTNLGCYGSIKATPVKMSELIALSEEIESAIGRRLEVISGGSSTSYPLIDKNIMPPRINNLRIGGAMLIPSNLRENFGCNMDGFYDDAFTFRAEVIEARFKPSYPVGEIIHDCFGEVNQFLDRGLRRRALIGVGKLDVCFPEKLIPRRSGIEVLGGSSDHIILDIEENTDNIQVGDILEFDLTYASMAFLTSSKSVKIIYKSSF